MFFDRALHPDVTARFKLFRGRVEALRSSRLLSGEHVPNRIHVSFDRATGVKFESQFPPDEDLHYFASRIRPFTLKGDDIGLRRICSLAKKIWRDLPITGWFSLAVVEYDAIRLNPDVSSGILLYDEDGAFISPGEVFDLYMYSEIQHVQLDMFKRLEALHEGKLVARSTFVAVCLKVAFGPLSLISHTLGMLMGDAPMLPEAEAGPPSARIAVAEALKQEGTILKVTPYGQHPMRLPAFKVMRWDPENAPQPFRVWMAEHRRPSEQDRPEC